MKTATAIAAITLLTVGIAFPAAAQLVTPISSVFSGRLSTEATNGPRDSVTYSYNFTPLIGPSGGTLYHELTGERYVHDGANYLMQTQVHLDAYQPDEMNGEFRFRHGAAVLCYFRSNCGSPPPGGTVQFIDIWTYSFTANASATLTFNYDLNTSTPATLFGQNDLPNEYRAPTSIMIFRENDCIACDGAISGSGQFRYALSAGQLYTYRLEHYSYASFAEGQYLSGPFGLAFGDDQYSFQITALSVPEPASWAMMIAGFGFVGGALRTNNMRRRTATAIAYA